MPRYYSIRIYIFASIHRACACKLTFSSRSSCWDWTAAAAVLLIWSNREQQMAPTAEWSVLLEGLPPSSLSLSTGNVFTSFESRGPSVCFLPLRMCVLCILRQGRVKDHRRGRQSVSKEISYSSESPNANKKWNKETQGKMQTEGGGGSTWPFPEIDVDEWYFYTGPLCSNISPLTHTEIGEMGLFFCLFLQFNWL